MRSASSLGHDLLNCRVQMKPAAAGQETSTSSSTRWVSASRTASAVPELMLPARAALPRCADDGSLHVYQFQIQFSFHRRIRFESDLEEQAVHDDGHAR